MSLCFVVRLWPAHAEKPLWACHFPTLGAANNYMFEFRRQMPTCRAWIELCEMSSQRRACEAGEAPASNPAPNTSPRSNE